MKINTISAYLLVYLLARGHWNLMVPVRADDADGSSTAGGSNEGTALAGSADGSGSSSGKPRSKAGSSAGSTASSTAGSDVAIISEVTNADPDGSDGSSAAPETGSSGEGASSGGTDAGHASSGKSASLTVSTGADGSVASSENGSGSDAKAESPGADANAGQSTPAAKVELGSLFPDYGSSVVEYTEGAYGKAMLDAKKADAKGLAEEARKTAQQLLEAAEKIKKEADELTKAAEDATKIEDIEAKMEDTAYKVGMERSQASEVAKPPDMMIYTGFPDGHHRLIDHASLVRLYKLHWWDKSTMHYSGFPDGWHGAHFGDADIMFQEAKKYREEKYANDLEAKKKQIAAKAVSIADAAVKISEKELDMKNKKVEVEAKLAELNAKKGEVNNVKKQIVDLQRILSSLESEARRLSNEYGTLLSRYGVMEVEHRLLEDDKKKLMKEHSVLEEEEWSIVNAYYELSERTKHFEGKHTESDDYVDPRENFTSFTEELGLVEVKPKDDVFINPADNFSEHPLYTGASLSGGSAAPAAEVEDGESVHETLSEAAEASSEATDAKAAPEGEVKAESAEAAPAPEAHVASTPVASSEEHVAPVNEEAAPANAGEAKAVSAEATPAGEGAQTVPAAVRLFKADATGAEVEMDVADYTKKQAAGDDRYEFKANVKCVKVMFGTNELWKKGDEGVDEPKFVAYNENAKALAVRDNERAVVYKKETDSDNWKHHKTVERSKTSGTSKTAAQTGTTPAPAAETTPEPGSLASSSALSGSKLNLAEASTGSGEAEETSSVTSEGSEGETGSGLRGATA